MLKYKESIWKVGNNLKIPPALIAGIISRQSRAGTNIHSNGYGQTDSNCYGLMQINKAYHAVKGGAFSEEHLDQGTTFLVQLIKTMQRTHPQWTKEQQLKGALACYISGEERVIPLAYEDVDSVTPNGDFASDVIARAQWFAKNGFRALPISCRLHDRL
ncbi:lysozyme g-like isoform X2 [Nelusetta ayraudi]|uniref:lysozyme g-like isoform X2 n=1 Tax=Nelusetta ayraudi TaxID=303726 RepID=UPI003F6E579E